MNLAELRPEGIRLDGLSRRWALLSAVVALIGLGGTAALFEAERFYHSWLVNVMFFLSLALGGLFFVIITHLVRAGWSIALRRVAEVLAWTVLPLSLPLLVVLLGLHELYEWSHADVVAHDALLMKKQAWLNPTFFGVRLVIYLLVWNLLAWFYLRTSLNQDASGDAGLTLRMERVSAPAAIVFALTVTLAAFDLMMSLYPHWYSTIYGVYYFSGCVLGAFSLVALLVTLLQRAGKLTDVVNVEHYHDAGKMMFAFVVFWAYIAFSQYMLIWYGNIPEETVWYEMRQSGNWAIFSLALLAGHFFVPFLWLLSRHIKRRRAVLALAAVWLLAVHWFDLFYLIMPRPGEGVDLRLLDLCCFMLIGGLVCAAAFWRLGRGYLIPVKDPRLAESLGWEHA